MSNLKEITNFINQFNYKSSYYDYFKSLSSANNHTSNKMYYMGINDFVSDSNITITRTIPTFNEFIYSHLKTSSFKNEVELYKDADIDRKRWSDLINNKSERPNKDLLFKLAISLKLSIDDTDTLLATKDYCINSDRKRDKAICYFIIDDDGRKISNLNTIERNIEINSLLEEIHQAPLY